MAAGPMPSRSTTEVRSTPIAWAEAQQAAAVMGDSLLKPSWLPFAGDQPSVVQHIPAANGGSLATITQYQGPDGEWVLIHQNHLSALGEPKIEGSVRRTTVKDVSVTVFRHRVATRAGSFDVVGAGWRLASGKHFLIQTRGLAEDQVVQVAAGMI